MYKITFGFGDLEWEDAVLLAMALNLEPPEGSEDLQISIGVKDLMDALETIKKMVDLGVLVEIKKCEECVCEQNESEVE